MKKSWLEFYALAVCFFTVACLAIFSGMAVWNGVSMTAPALTLDNHEWSKHQTDIAFRKAWLIESRWHDENGQRAEKLPESADIPTMRQASYQQVLASERRSAFQDLLQNLIVILIDLVLFVVHWKVARYARSEAQV